MTKTAAVLFTLTLAATGAVNRAEIKVTVERNRPSEATPAYHFEEVPPPSKSDAATAARFSIVAGERDRNGAELAVLHDGRLPGDEDQPSANFFFQAGSEGGRIVADLGKPVRIEEVNTYSWHPEGRGPQVYKLYASDGSGPGFEAEPAPGVSLEEAGWNRIAEVDTRRERGRPGGQYGVSISDSEGLLGEFRYLLFDVAPTADEPFAQTFFSEIDVVEPGAPAVPAYDPNQPGIQTLEIGGKYTITIDTSAARDLTEWAETELAPVVREWYPKLVEMLPSDGYEAPRRVRIIFNDGRGVASASGNRIRCAADWFRRNLDGEAKGAVVHELVHVVQNYGWGRRNNPDAARTPGWVVEGIPDYIRWFIYEPETKGAEITARNLDRARYDANYRISANFLNWVVERHGEELIQKLNAAARAGRYNEEIWKELAGKSVEQLGKEWREEMERRVAGETAEKAES